MDLRKPHVFLILMIPLLTTQQEISPGKPSSNLLFRYVGKKDLKTSHLHIVCPLRLDTVIDQAHAVHTVLKDHQLSLATLLHKKSVTKSVEAMLLEEDARLATTILKGLMSTIDRKLDKLNQTLQAVSLPTEKENPFQMIIRYQRNTENNDQEEGRLPQGEIFQNEGLQPIITVKAVNDTSPHAQNPDSNLSNSTLALPSFTRRKRQLELIFGLVGLGNSVYNSFQIKSIQDRLNDVNAREDVIVKQIELHQKAIEEVQSILTSVQREVMEMIEEILRNTKRITVLRITSRMEYCTTVIVEHIDNTINALQQLIHNHLHPAFVDLKTLTGEFKKIDKDLSKRSMKLFDTNPTAIYHYPLNVYRIGSEVRYVVHVPISTHLEQLNILEFLPTPFHLGNFTAIIKTDKPFLIIDDHKTFGVEVGANFLDKCLRSKTSFHCTHESVYSKAT